MKANTPVFVKKELVPGEVQTKTISDAYPINGQLHIDILGFKTPVPLYRVRRQVMSITKREAI